MAVDELAKPVHQWCRHAGQTRHGEPGCTIWPDRPASCRQFYCAWRIHGEIPEAWRPDRVHFFLATHDDPTALPCMWLDSNPLYRHAWQSHEARALIGAVSAPILVVRHGLDWRVIRRVGPVGALQFAAEPWRRLARGEQPTVEIPDA